MEIRTSSIPLCNRTFNSWRDLTFELGATEVQLRKLHREVPVLKHQKEWKRKWDTGSLLNYLTLMVNQRVNKTVARTLLLPRSSSSFSFSPLFSLEILLPRSLSQTKMHENQTETPATQDKVHNISESNTTVFLRTKEWAFCQGKKTLLDGRSGQEESQLFFG